MVKDLNPSTDSGTLQPADRRHDPTKANVGDGGTTGEKTLNTGTHTVGEIAGNSGAPGRLPEVDRVQGQQRHRRGRRHGRPRLGRPAERDRRLRTTTSSARSPTPARPGKLEVVKDLNPSTDPGKFNLQIDGSTDAEAPTSATAGRPARRRSTPAPHTVGEIGGHVGTNLADYQKSIECVRQRRAATSSPGRAADSAGPLNVTVAYGDDIVCTITNTRETGKLEVVKDLNPSTDPGTLQPADRRHDRRSANVGDGGTTGEKTLNTGTAHRGRDRRQRPATWPTTRSRSSARTRTAPARGRPRLVPIGRPAERERRLRTTTSSARSPTPARPGKLEVVKDLNPSTDPGRFNLQIDGTTARRPTPVTVASTGEKTVNTGTAHRRRDRRHLR